MRRGADSGACPATEPGPVEVDRTRNPTRPPPQSRQTRHDPVCAPPGTSHNAGGPPVSVTGRGTPASAAPPAPPRPRRMTAVSYRWPRSPVLVVGQAHQVQNLVIDVGHAAQRDLVGGLARAAGRLQAPGRRRAGEPQPEVDPVPRRRRDRRELASADERCVAAAALDAHVATKPEDGLGESVIDWAEGRLGAAVLAVDVLFDARPYPPRGP